VSDTTPERWEAIPGGPGYECSWDGNFRSVDRVSPSGRRLKGQPIATTIGKDGYVLVKYWDAQGRRVTRQAHRVVLETFAGPCPDGMQSRHYDDDPRNNRWRPGSEEESRARGGNLFRGTGRDQHADKVRNNGGPLPVSPPAHDCVNHARCGGRTRNPGRRCVPCVEQVGRDAGDMLRGGENLLKVAQHFGYTGTDWVFSLAVKHGGYRGTRAQAQAQRRRWSQRVATTVRKRLRRGDKGSRPRRKPAASLGGEAGTAPFGRPSHQDTLGHSGHPRTRDVAERDRPDVTERDRAYPYPADLTQRDRARRPSGGVTRRSR
jgi:hypothetical protein